MEEHFASHNLTLGVLDVNETIKLDVDGFPLESFSNICLSARQVSRQFLSFLKIHGGDYLHIG